MFSASGKGTWSGFLTYDMLHGGGHRHWEVINRIATEYELGKNQSGHGSFTGKDVRLQDDGSIMIMLLIRLRLRIKLGRARVSNGTPDAPLLRSNNSQASRVAKETRRYLAVRVACSSSHFRCREWQTFWKATRLRRKSIVTREPAHVSCRFHGDASGLLRETPKIVSG